MRIRESDIESPLIPGSRTQKVGAFSTAKLISEWQVIFDIDVSSEFGGIEEISLYRCEVSQLDFFSPFCVAGSERLYRELGKFDWYYMVDKWEFRRALIDLSDRQRILEVGCGSGLFLEEIIRQLPGSSVRGIELSEWAIQQARRRNLPVEQIDLEALIDRHETFDAVYSLQVLEHLSEPRAFLESLVTLLPRGGKLLLGVPNKESFLKHQYNLLDLPPHHMTRWGAFTFKYLEKLFPLKLVRVRLEPLAKYHINGYVSAYAQYWGAKFPVVQNFLSNRRVDEISRVIEKAGWYRFLRGQTLYALFERL